MADLLKLSNLNVLLWHAQLQICSAVGCLVAVEVQIGWPLDTGLGFSFGIGREAPEVGGGGGGLRSLCCLGPGL